MRKESRTERTVQSSRVQRYHEGGYSCSDDQAYAYMGYSRNLYFKSDRAIKLDERFNTPDGSALKGYGLEIELECEGIVGDDRLANVLEKIVFPCFPEGLFKMQHDGSLGNGYYSSAECITQVMTKAFIRNHYKDFKAMYNDYFKMFGITCSSGHCGMHVNISNANFGSTKKTQDEAIRKLYYIVNRHFDLCCALFNRDSRNTGYCSRMSYDDAQTMNLSGAGSNHYICFNLGHYDAGRIELRLVGGQKDFGCFRNTMESIFHLIEAVKTLSWNQLDDLTAIFKGCNQYVYDRLSSKCLRAGTIRQEQLEKIAETVKREQLL